MTVINCLCNCYSNSVILTPSGPPAHGLAACSVLVRHAETAAAGSVFVLFEFFVLFILRVVLLFVRRGIWADAVEAVPPSVYRQRKPLTARPSKELHDSSMKGRPHT